MLVTRLARRVGGAGAARLELESKVKRRFAKVSIVSYSMSSPSLMIIASASQFHVERRWGQRPFSIDYIFVCSPDRYDISPENS